MCRLKGQLLQLMLYCNCWKCQIRKVCKAFKT